MKASEINKKWKALQSKIATDFDSEAPDLKVILFLIGVQELGKGPKKYSKRQKEELMHIATCRLLSEMGFYELEGLDQDGWPHWKLIKAIPAYTSLEQEMLLKGLAISYFEEIYDTEF
ncbi:MAG: hypothetical protein EOO99_05840 [Pedobacter sp.]|nr:MAG: hypothetical protein EOO99_05840 [Pedobacter sp.]